MHEKEIIFYKLKMLDGKFHIFKRTILKTPLKVEELDVVFDYEDLADNYVNAKNSEVLDDGVEF